MRSPIPTIAEVREALGADADGLTDEQIEVIARRIYTMASVFRQSYVAQRAHAAAAPK